jgi:hypothetical protein
MEQKDNDQKGGVMPSRRQFVGGITAGLIGAFAVPALAQPEAGSPAESAPASGPSADQNPLTEYPKPPFPPQTQEPPGLAGKMSPRPDHGEKSYKGAGRLTGRKALVTGGDSGMGRAASTSWSTMPPNSTPSTRSSI